MTAIAAAVIIAAALLFAFVNGYIGQILKDTK